MESQKVVTEEDVKSFFAEMTGTERVVDVASVPTDHRREESSK